MQKSTFNILFYVKRNAVKANGKMPIMGRITVNGEAVQFGAKTEVNPKIWDTKSGKAVGKTQEVIDVNGILESIKATMTKIYHDLQEQETTVTPERIKNIFFGVEIRQQMFLEHFQRHNDDVERLIGISKSKATYQKYEVTRKHLADFIKEKYNLSDISFKEINHLFLTDFEVYLLTSCGCNPNTTAKFMQFFKRIVIIAKNNGWIKADPFANYKIRLKKVDRGYLTQEEVEAIMAKKFSTKRLEQVRDIFVFSCFCGLAYIDVKKLRKENIRTSFDGNLWIMGKREKTDVTFSIPLLDIPKKILEKYEGALPDNRILPVPSNQKMNAYLKEIGDLCEINKEISFHMGRHSFSSLITLEGGVPIETVSKMLGHSDIKTTQIYARVTPKKLFEDMDKYIEASKDLKLVL
ncbi:site-specific integrase [Bacteroides sp. 519]|uniref:site-specific integrase n=1 Tax=Bacteroides sp. 519 TaxID=2302937 RepID=UPI0013D592E2|nr:site-specific integrase [Bacteroides sp. 519]NDV56775.1 site-specific integrase [Bacteroides sp. 519]